MKILLCVAGMPYAEAAVSQAGLIARATGSPLMLLHVVRRGSDLEAGERVVAAVRRMLPGMPVDSLVVEGEPVVEILREARRGEHDLIVMGAQRGGGVARQLLGSVTQQIIRRADISVLVARGLAPGSGGMGRVLICTGGADVANPVIEAGALLCAAVRSPATLFHVMAPAPEMYAGLSAVEEPLSRLLQTDTPIARHLRRGAAILARHSVPATLRVQHGLAADEILGEALAGGYGLVVIGASGTAGRLRAWLLGNVTRQIAERATCSVLVVKGARRLFA